MELPIFSGLQHEIDFGEKAITIKHEKPAKAPKKLKPDIPGLRDRIQKTRMATTGFIGSAGRVVRSVDEAASLLAPIRKYTRK